MKKKWKYVQPIFQNATQTEKKNILIMILNGEG